MAKLKRNSQTSGRIGANLESYKYEKGEEMGGIHDDTQQLHGYLNRGVYGWRGRRRECQEGSLYIKWWKRD